MTLDMHDASYPFVLEANLKEEENRRKRARRAERAKNPNPWWFIVSAILMGCVTLLYVQNGITPVAILFAVLTAAHIYLAYSGFKRRL